MVFCNGIYNIGMETNATLSVTQLNSQVAAMLAAQLPMLRVRGEAQGVKRYASGHVYFTLKDAAASVSCVLFKMRAQLFDRLPREGELIELRAKVTLYEPRGDYQLRVDGWQPAGQGALYESFLALKAKLAAEGLMDDARKRAIPLFVRRVGIVTSLQAAVLRDVASVLKARAPHLTLIVYPSAVQGADAGEQLAAAVRTASARAAQDQIDVLLVCRGGGSMEDLWCFNHESLARAIASCAVPVISGVGHETDFTICDFVADSRAPTPTAAAQSCTLSTDDWLGEIEGIGAALLEAAHSHIATQAQTLDMLALRLAKASPANQWRMQASQLAQVQQRMSHAAARTIATQQLRLARSAARINVPNLQPYAVSLSQAKNRLNAASKTHLHDQSTGLASLSAQLQALSPQRVLERGYAVVLDSAGQAITAPAASGAAVTIQYANGQQGARVD